MVRYKYVNLNESFIIAESKQRAYALCYHYNYTIQFEMSDIKAILSLLCQHLSVSLDVTFKPEYFRLAKFNKTAENVAEAFWKLLDILSFQVVKEKGIDVEFPKYDLLSTVKLYFALLQYPVLEFYALTENCNNNRQLLLAFVWLLGTQNALSTIIRTKLTLSALGRESGHLKASESKEFPDHSTKSLAIQINDILHLSGKVNYNVKYISELLSERVKLVVKAHAASINISGLPHLSVSELALTKRISAINKETYSNEDKRQIKELIQIGNLLDIHIKWTKKEKIFFEWTVTIFEEYKKSLNTNLSYVDWQELSKFVSLLRHVINEKIKFLSDKHAPHNWQDYKNHCVSRLLRTQENNTEVESWLTKTTVQLTKETEDLSQKKEELSKELKGLLELITSCVQV